MTLFIYSKGSEVTSGGRHERANNRKLRGGAQRKEAAESKLVACGSILNCKLYIGLGSLVSLV